MDSDTVVVVSCSSVYPPTTGGAHRSHGLMTAFREAGDEIFRFCQAGPVTRWVNDEAHFVEIDARYREQRGDHNPLHDIARAPALFGFPYLLLNPALRLAPSADLVRAVRSADVVLVEGPWQVSPVARIAGDTPVVYSTHDVEYEKYEARYGGSLLTRPLSRWIEKIERGAIRSADVVVCTCERDRISFKSRYRSDADYLVVPNGVDRETVRTPDVADTDLRRVRSELGLEEETTVALFVGSDHEPNVEAVDQIQIIAEECAEQGYDVEFLVAGTVSRRVEQSNRLRLLGFVDDLDVYYALSDIALNPIISGSGTNVKLLEYMAKRLPVVSTPFGGRGFDLQDRTNVLIANPDEFSDRIGELAESADLRRRIGRNAQSFVSREFTWDRISERFREQLRSMTSPTPP